MATAVRDFVNSKFDGKDSFTVVCTTVGGIACYCTARWLWNNRAELSRRWGKAALAAMSGAPGLGAQKDKLLEGLAKDLLRPNPPGVNSYASIPEKGLPHQEVLSQMEKMAALDTPHWVSGKLSGGVYWGDKKHLDLLNTASAMFAVTNPLHADVFPSTRKFESEVVSMALRMMNADEKCCGTMTTGGTESILMAIKTYRDWARETKGIKQPNVVAPHTAHAAFDKACGYFCIELRKIPVGPDFKSDVAAMERAIDSNTICLVGSAPQFPHGIIDDIERLAAIALRRGIGMHVDSCLGGFFLPWAKKLGYDIPPFDLSVKGVTSMSADTHKYAYATKGTSVVLYNSPELRRFQYFCITNWAAGVYASPSICGSRAGSLIAACWASLVALGEDGFMTLTDGIMKTARNIIFEVPKIPGLCILGEPKAGVFALGAKDFDVYRLGAGMASRGWNLTNLQSPPGIHISVTAKQIGMDKEFLKDVREIVAEIKADPKAHTGGSAAVYGMAAQIPDGLVKDLAIGDFAFSYIDTTLKVVS